MRMFALWPKRARLRSVVVVDCYFNGRRRPKRTNTSRTAHVRPQVCSREEMQCKASDGTDAARGGPSPGADVAGVRPVVARRRRGELACERAGTAAEAQFESATVAPPLLAHVRSRDWLPEPQVTEQAPHGPGVYLLDTA